MFVRFLCSSHCLQTLCARTEYYNEEQNRSSSGLLKRASGPAQTKASVPMEDPEGTEEPLVRDSGEQGQLLESLENEDGGGLKAVRHVLGHGCTEGITHLGS